jgi:DNA mismatch endonuclease (patch repair protein)
MDDSATGPFRPEAGRKRRRRPKREPLTRSEIMQRIKGKDTKPEMAVRRALWAAGYRYRLHDRSLPGRPDLILKGLRTAIFVHGCFWHAHEGCPAFRPPKTRQDYWTAKLARNQARDREAVRKLEEDGWRVVVLWECQLAKVGWLEGLIEALRGIAAGPAAASEARVGRTEAQPGSAEAQAASPAGLKAPRKALRRPLPRDRTRAACGGRRRAGGICARRGLKPPRRAGSRGPRLARPIEVLENPILAGRRGRPKRVRPPRP